MDKGQMPNRTVNLSYAPEDQALVDELRSVLLARTIRSQNSDSRSTRLRTLGT